MSVRDHESARATRSAEWRRWNGRIRTLAKQLGIDDEARRALQKRETGKASCADMSVAELRRVAAAMHGRPPHRSRTRGRAPGGRNQPTRKLGGKLLALWISGWHLGVVRDRTDDGLAEWLRRQMGHDAAWPDAPGMARAVEALQAWLAREAGVDWSPYVVRSCARGSESALGRDGRARSVDRPQARVLEAQWRILHRAGLVRIAGNAALAAYACEHAGLGRADSHLALSEAQTIALMQSLGARVRKARGEAAA